MPPGRQSAAPASASSSSWLHGRSSRRLRPPAPLATLQTHRRASLPRARRVSGRGPAARSGRALVGPG
eukprot:scaffold12453_cov106-Isochrysis_galbana.AAC.3